MSAVSSTLAGLNVTRSLPGAGRYHSSQSLGGRYRFGVLGDRTYNQGRSGTVPLHQQGTVRRRGQDSRRCDAGKAALPAGFVVNAFCERAAACWLIGDTCGRFASLGNPGSTDSTQRVGIFLQVCLGSGRHFLCIVLPQSEPEFFSAGVSIAAGVSISRCEGGFHERFQ